MMLHGAWDVFNVDVFLDRAVSCALEPEWLMIISSRELAVYLYCFFSLSTDPNAIMPFLYNKAFSVSFFFHTGQCIGLFVYSIGYVNKPHCTYSSLAQGSLHNSLVATFRTLFVSRVNVLHAFFASLMSCSIEQWVFDNDALSNILGQKKKKVAMKYY